QLFDGVDPATGQNPDVWLEVAGPRKTAHAGGSAQLWVDDGKGKTRLEDWYHRIALGLVEEELSTPNVGSRAVLTRNNSHRESLQQVLIDHGFAVTGGGARLLDTREGAAVRAGIAWLLDDQDTQALIELILLL